MGPAAPVAAHRVRDLQSEAANPEDVEQAKRRRFRRATIAVEPLLN